MLVTLTAYTTTLIHVPTLISIAYLVHLTYKLTTSSLTNSIRELDRTRPSTNPGLLNGIGSWLYILGYLTVRMWLVFALHGFCTASISTLIDSVNGSMPVLGLIILVVGGLCTLGYVAIQTYVYVSFILMYYRSDVSSYYPLLTLVVVSLTALLPTPIGIPTLFSILLISSVLYCSCPRGVVLPSSTHSTPVSTCSSSSTLGTRLDVSGRSWLGVSTGSTTVMWIPLLVCTHVGLGVLTPISGFYAGIALTVLSLCSESTSVSQYRGDSTCYAWLLLCEVIAFLSVGSYYSLVIGLDTASTLTLFGAVPWSISEVMCLLSLLVLLLFTLSLEYAVRSYRLVLSCSKYPLGYTGHYWGETSDPLDESWNPLASHFKVDTPITVNATLHNAGGDSWEGATVTPLVKRPLGHSSGSDRDASSFTSSNSRPLVACGGSESSDITSSTKVVVSVTVMDESGVTWSGSATSRRNRRYIDDDIDYPTGFIATGSGIIACGKATIYATDVSPVLHVGLLIRGLNSSLYPVTLPILLTTSQ